MHSDYRKRIIRYLKRTRDVGLTLRGGSDQRLAVWSDSGWAECKDTRKSTSGVVVTMGSSVIFAKSYTQPTIANSSCEAELYAQFKASLYALFRVARVVPFRSRAPDAVHSAPDAVRRRRDGAVLTWHVLPVQPS